MNSKSIVLTKTYSEKARNKVLSVRVNAEESKYVADVAHSFGYSISSLIREAIQNRVNQLLSDAS